MASSERVDPIAADPAHDESQLERLTFFSDAVFAIAMTLLVIEVRLPPLHEASEAALAQALADLLPHYIGFLSSFLVIGRFWVGHHQVFGLLAGTSDRLLWANLLFLLAIAFLPFPTAVLSEHIELSVGVCFYGLWLMLLGLLDLWLLAVAFGGGGRLVKPGVDPALPARRRRGPWVPVLIGAVALAAGLVSPVTAGVALMVSAPLISWAMRRWTTSRFPLRSR